MVNGQIYHILLSELKGSPTWAYNACNYRLQGLKRKSRLCIIKHK